MENSDEEVDEDETEWRSSFTDSEVTASVSGSTFSKTPPPTPAQRVILHLDLDCFYAQVEMIRNPALRSVPLGIQQKYIIVTCNYVAREHGVTKLMSVTDAKEKCPQLVLVKGEDLTHYREMSYKVTELLMSSCPLVERLGFDENFVDVTEMVEKRLKETPESSSCSFKGHVYNRLSADAKAGDHPRLALGSHIAAELREAINSRLGLTGCAGIATSKLLAKLVSGSFKPNQQTTLLSEDISEIMSSLSGIRKVPGVGHQTAKRLQALGVVSVQDLQLFPLADLVKEFGASSAQRLRNLALGRDDTPVTPTGAPQSLSDEDSFKKMSSTKDVLQKIQDLLSSLVDRMHKDGRQPQTFRLTIRRYSATNKWFSRESRQCPIPNHIGHKITSGSGDALVQLVSMAMKLFHKMVDSNTAFHLTLINVCFANLQSRAASAGSKGSITSFFKQGTSPKKTQSSAQNQVTLSNSVASWIIDLDVTWSTVAHRVCCTSGLHPDETNNTPKLPPNVDPDVFRHLPEEIQRELLSHAYANSLSSPLTPSTSQAATVAAFDGPRISKNPPQQCPPASKTALWSFSDSHNLKDKKDAVSSVDPSDRETTVNLQLPAGLKTAAGDTVMEERRTWSSDCEFPADVDPKVFSELPLDVQRELMSTWKQQRPVLKTPSSWKQGRGSVTKDRKAAGKSSQANNLLKYFKPN
uniref:Polymerase (DNA directed) iota n=1 Tax=Myripristis murdjan TaxID=586833 RepID=A0A667YA33_9TELE